jgi:predicted nucleic acid-binding protein
MKILLDTNILTRLAHGEEDPDYDAAERSLEILRTRGHVLCLVPQNLYEFWSVATRPLDANGLGMTTTEADAELDELTLPLFQVLQDERAILPRWKDLVRHYDVKGKVSHDARLVAAMLRHGVSHMLTFNAVHFARFAEVTVVTPANVLVGESV